MPRVNNQLAVQALEDLEAGQRLRGRPGQYPATGIKLASMTGALVAPFDFADSASKMSAHSRHGDNSFPHRHYEQPVVGKEYLAPRWKALRRSNTEHRRRATGQVGNE